ncbi:peptide/nickel transport system substrate-binding protein [Nocardioides alpinus]|jgi:peptide/nickel transport system substrate-binding protein|uniref:ABC transporter substrate-binding protein n=2 Tax=Nocardioides TaxID=1839 RepID=A0A4Q2SNH0_9ACTN|nr:MULTISPECIES: ABC transporter substrate-binding protein [Nocardioides]PKH40144.1 ABC transporter substrate-binding protein [Nocardioides alpinus]RYC05618.1 ABC transporter substrate-binding protein [Nocardioides zhouii]SFB44582.1 peptide/nickel transport system substrate-binding protein [Nocardioides alpinus]
MTIRPRWRTLITLSLVVSAALTGCGRQTDDSDRKPSETLADTTPAGTDEVTSAVWAVNGDIKSLDPLYTFDYPGNTAVSLMCESLLTTMPDGSIGPGVAKISRPTETTVVFDINEGARFWDGTPVTAEDVVYSLERQRDPALGGFYGAFFDRVDTISATDPLQVTLNLTAPDYWLDGELAGRAGVVLQKKYVETRGESYGTSSGGVMCTGAYELESWVPATGIVMKANPDPWQGATPRVEQLTVKSIADEAALTSSLLTGEVDGTYRPAGMSTLDQLRASDDVEVFQGPGYNTDALIVSSLDGALGDARVRRALALALDREGIIDSVYKGAAQMPKWISNSGTFGYAPDVFEAAYERTPTWAQDLSEAKALVAEAGAEGKTVTIGMTAGLAQIAAAAGAYESAAAAIGMKVKLKAVSTENFINFFIDPKAREGIDGFLTVDYGDYADPVALVASIVLPNGSRNYAGLEDDRLIELTTQARATADPEERAKVVVQVMNRFNEVLPWIPMVQPNTVLVMNRELSGAVSSFAYMSAQWAGELGGR